MSSPEIVQWLASTPEASSKPQESDYLDPSVVAERIRARSKDLAIIDLRKNDYLGGKIQGSINVPAQSFYHSTADLYDLFEKAGKKEIIVHCVSSRDRATRTWGWLKDYSNSKADGHKLDLHILKGGFNAFKNDPSNSDLIQN